MIDLVAFLVFSLSPLRYALKTLFELWTIAYLGKYSPVFSVQTFLRDERSRVSNMSSVGRGVCSQRGSLSAVLCSETPPLSSHSGARSTFTAEHPQKTHNNPQTSNLLHSDFSLSSHSPLTPGREYRKTSTRLECLTSDLWLRRNVLISLQNVVTWERSRNFSYSFSDIKDGDLSPYHWEQALSPYLKWEQHIPIFSASEAWYGMVGSLIFSPSIKDQRPGETSASTFQLLLLTGETEARLRCKRL